MVAEAKRRFDWKTPLGELGRGNFECVEGDLGRMVFRIAREDGTRIGWINGDREWMTVDLGGKRAVFNYVADRKKIEASYIGGEMASVKSAVNLFKASDGSTRDLVLELAGDLRVCSYIEVSDGCGSRKTEKSENRFRIDSPFLMVAFEPSLVHPELLTVYTSQEKIDRSPLAFGYHVGIKNHGEEGRELWATKDGESISWRLPWRVDFTPEEVREMVDVDIDLLPERLDKALKEKFGRMATDRPVASRK